MSQSSLIMFLVWAIEWESDMKILIFITLFIGAILGGSLVYLYENYLRTNEMIKINKLDILVLRNHKSGKLEI